MDALILSAGAGVRIRPLSLERPKGLMPVLDVPPIFRHRAKLAESGIDRVWVNSHLHTPQLEEACRSLTELGMPTETSVEMEVLGTAGAIRKLKAELSGPLMILNADIVSNLDLNDLIASHLDSATLATLAVAPGPRTDVEMDGPLVTKLATERRESPGLTYCGMAIFQPEVVELIERKSSGLYEEVFVPLVSNGQMSAHLTQAHWKDIGTLSAYLEANLDSLDGVLVDVDSLRPAFPFERWDLQAYVGTGASTDDCGLRRCVVGSGAMIEAGSDLQRCVVWPETSIPKGSYRDAVFTPLNTIQV